MYWYLQFFFLNTEIHTYSEIVHFNNLTMEYILVLYDMPVN